MTGFLPIRYSTELWHVTSKFQLELWLVLRLVLGLDLGVGFRVRVGVVVSVRVKDWVLIRVRLESG